MELNELQEQIKRCNSLSDISSVQEIDANTLFMSVLKAGRYDLLKTNNITKKYKQKNKGENYYG